MPSLKQGLRQFKERTKQLKQEIYLQKLLIGNYFFKKETEGMLNIHSMFMDSMSHSRSFDRIFYELANSLDAELGSLSSALANGKGREVGEHLRILLEAKGNDSISAYDNLFGNLSRRYEIRPVERVGTPLQDTILELIINRQCTFIEKCEKTEYEKIGASTKDEFRDYAVRMKKIYEFDLEAFMGSYIALLEEIRGFLGKRVPELNVDFSRTIPPLSQFSSLETTTSTIDQERAQKTRENKTGLKKAVAKLTDWKNLGQLIADYYKSVRSVSDAEVLTLIPTMFGLQMTSKSRRRKVDFEELINYEEQKRQLVANTEKLLKGEEANNVFITGPQGTGKSSMVNALLTKYSKQGLRVIELPAEFAPHMPAAFNFIESRPEYKFIILVDEFKAREDDCEYVKKAIEGSFESLPQNARFYVISNKEDNLQVGFNGETDRSLEDRFGLVVKFPNPDFNTIQQIMQYYVKKEKIKLSETEVQSRFDQYCNDRKINSPNPRNIRDFVKTLT